MKFKWSFLLVLCLVANRIDAAPLGTAFSYQGFLSAVGSPASGKVDFQFSLYDAAGSGNLIGPVLTNTGVAVNNGLFLVTLDFGDVFDGNSRWLAIGVRNNGSSGAFTALTPLQELTPSPYSLYASNASGASPGSGSVTASSLNTPGGSPASGQVLGYNGTNLVWVTGGGSAGSSNAWSLTGNAGTSPASGNFIGTTDEKPLELRVDGVRALQLMPTADAPNVIGGAPSNFVASGTIGATIAGGGTITLYGRAYSNSIFADNGTIGGGLGNTIQTSAYESTIAGGNQNVVQSGANDATIGGGFQNTIVTGSTYATIAGGDINMIGGGATYSAIAGGQQNTIQTNADNSFIGGGYQNEIQTNSTFSTISGGSDNTITKNSGLSIIAGGAENTIDGTAEAAIGGGFQNQISAGAASSAIGGGFSNSVTYANDAFIGGGKDNQIEYGLYSSINGGASNGVANDNSAIGGGYGNQIYYDGSNSVIAGGIYDQILGFGEAIGGGESNIVGISTEYSTISGGFNNIIVGSDSSIAGGANNQVLSGGLASAIGGGAGNLTSGQYATVPGGLENTASGFGSFAAGNAASATSTGSFVWGDGSRGAQDQGANTFNVLATGGVYIFDSASDINTGTQLLPGTTSWQVMCDRNKKKNFKPVDCQAVLEKLMSVPIQQWNYKWESDTNTPNIGPMAQDFKPAFYPGRDDKGISTLEFDGVELAAIQGVDQKLEERDQRLQAALKEKDAKIAQLENELAEVKSAQHQNMAQWEARFEALQKALDRVADKQPSPLAAVSAGHGQK